MTSTGARSKPVEISHRAAAEKQKQKKNADPPLTTTAPTQTHYKIQIRTFDLKVHTNHQNRKHA
jgi:hypothetical protein